MKRISLFKISFTHILWLIAGFIIPLALHLVTSIGIKESYYSLILFAGACVIFHYYTSKKNYEKQIGQLMAGFTLYVTIHFLYNLVLSYSIIQEWDFLCFYLFGKVGISSPDFYNPELFQQVFNNLQLQSLSGGDFVSEIVNVGFWYPPPTMLLFLPLGLFDLQTGHFIWQTIIILFLIVDIILLLKFYFVPLYKTYKDIRILFPLLLLIILFPFITVIINLSQTISIFLFFLLLLIHYINSWKAGVFLAILVVIKPLGAIFILYFLFFRKWKIVAASTVTGLILLMTTGIIFGFDVFFNYFNSLPTDRIPDFVYFEYSSLFSGLKKLSQYAPQYLTVSVYKTLYYLISLVLIVITLYASRKLSRTSNTMAFLIFIPFALIIYPATLFHYDLILLPVFLSIFYQAPLKNNILKLGLLFGMYGIGYYSPFLLNFILWLILVLWPLSFRFIENNNFFNNLHFNSRNLNVKKA